MKKYLVQAVSALIFVGVVVGIFTVANARTQRSAVDTAELAQESCTSKTVDTSQTASVDVIGLATALAGATYVEVYNADGTNAVNLGFTSSVSTTSTSANYGREILPRTGLGLAINLDKILTLYVGTQKTTGVTRVTVIQCR